MNRSALIAAGLLILGAALPVRGLEPYLVKDINPVSEGNGSDPSHFVELGGAAVFTAFDGEIGLGLWRSDGTAAGTWKLADVCPVEAACGATVLAAVEGRAFLALGTDLWITEGTVAGTRRLTDHLEAVSPQAAWVPEQRTLYFFATDRAHGTELWRSDGTPAGTRLVADLTPGPLSSETLTLTAFRGRAWFSARTQSRNGAVWTSDGTQPGTAPFLQSSLPGLPRINGVVGNRLLFMGRFGKVAGLWSTDGTARGTSRLLSLEGRVYDSVVRNGRLFFTADTAGRGQELWVSDGTVRGSRVVSDIPGRDAFHGSTGANLSLPRTTLPGRFLFQARDPEHGVELWASDGTPAGTRLVRDVCPGPCDGAGLVLMSNQGLFYFIGSDRTSGMELWASDGTSAGTRLVRDLCPGACNSTPIFPFRFAGRLLFMADDVANGRELWTTDGTAAGTVRITDFADPKPLFLLQGVPLAGRFVFAAADAGRGRELWSTDGTIAGTQLLADINQSDFGGSAVRGLRKLGDEAVFFADDGIHGYRLWKSDGTAAGTRLLADLVPGRPSGLVPSVVDSAELPGALVLLLADHVTGLFSLCWTDGTEAGTDCFDDPVSLAWYYSELHAAGGKAFFTATTSTGQNQLWVTDGTKAGTRKVLDSRPDAAFTGPFGLSDLNGSLYFFDAGPTRESPVTLWRTDGTAAGTVRVADVRGPHPFAPPPVAHGGRLWFPGFPDGTIVSTDGTPAGTRSVTLPVPALTFLEWVGDTLLLSGFAGTTDSGLWASDGTPEGTRSVGRLVDVLSPWTVFQGRLFYGVDERFDSHPMLWTSDGTRSGTGRLLDRDGHPIPAPLGFAVFGDGDDLLIFTTADPPAVWQTDGTAAGTFPIAPLRPVGDNPGDVARAGGRVFFGAWEPATGQELWAVGPAAP